MSCTFGPHLCTVLLQSDMTEVPAAEQAAGVQFPWQLKCCSSSGETKLYNMPRKDDDLFFAGVCSRCAFNCLAVDSIAPSLQLLTKLMPDAVRWNGCYARQPVYRAVLLEWPCMYLHNEVDTLSLR